MKKNKILSLLGLATRSRNVVSGEFMTEKAVKNYSAELVIVAEDASDNTKKSRRECRALRKMRLPPYPHGTFPYRRGR